MSYHEKTWRKHKFMLLVKEGNQKMPHAARFQLQNILEKAKWWKQKKDQELPGVAGQGWTGRAQRIFMAVKILHSILNYNNEYKCKVKVQLPWLRPHARSESVDRFLSVAAAEMVIITKNWLPTVYQMLDQVLYIHLILRFNVGVIIFKVRLKEGKSTCPQWYIQ